MVTSPLHHPGHILITTEVTLHHPGHILITTEVRSPQADIVGLVITLSTVTHYTPGRPLYSPTVPPHQISTTPRYPGSGHTHQSQSLRARRGIITNFVTTCARVTSGSYERATFIMCNTQTRASPGGLRFVIGNKTRVSDPGPDIKVHHIQGQLNHFSSGLITSGAPSIISQPGNTLGLHFPPPCHRCHTVNNCHK